ncbi:RNA polymerase sigma factor [Cellvibrio japonicus]|nr:RNA polymerase sigma factor [Cellvibrio japonicus]
MKSLEAATAGADMSSPPDEQLLIRRAQAGDASAFEQLLGHYYDLMFRFAFRWSGQRSDAEDITQNACLKLARSIGQFRFESAFSSWLYRLVINCAKDWYKSQGHARDAQPLDAVPEALCDDASHIPVYLRQVLQQLETLADGFKETALLVHGEGLSHAEAASILNIKEATVSWRLHEIRKYLQTLQSCEGVNL